MKQRHFLLLCISLLLPGCAMFGAWKTIPPPGGCDQCHTVPISSNWEVAYHAPALTDERDKLAFQSEQSTIPPQPKPASALDLRKVTELPCFDCHRSPNKQHGGRKGSFHH